MAETGVFDSEIEGEENTVYESIVTNIESIETKQTTVQNNIDTRTVSNRNFHNIVSNTWLSVTELDGKFLQYLRVSTPTSLYRLSSKSFDVTNQDFLLEKGRKYIVNLTIDTSRSPVAVTFQLVMKPTSMQLYAVKTGATVFSGERPYPENGYYKCYEPCLTLVADQDYHLAFRMSTDVNPVVFGSSFTLPTVTVHILEL